MLENSFQKDLIEAGCDEAGRGCLAGPVFAAAVILPHDFYHPLLNDSKKMSAHNRELLRGIICENAISWAVASVSAEQIDKTNILKASIKAMNDAVEQLVVKPELLVIDGNRFSTVLDIPYKCIVKGDGKYANIAAASVLAKTFRDEYMVSLAKQFPLYGFEIHKGYPTLMHRKAIAQYGLCPEHRRTFNHSKIEQLDFVF